MELRTPPRPRRLDPDSVSSPPPPSPPWKQRLHPDLVSSPSPPGKRARKQRFDPDSVSSPPPPPPPSKQAAEERYEPDVWTEVAKHLRGADLVCLALTRRWFHRLLFFEDDSIWRHAFLRDLSLRTDDPRLLKFTIPGQFHQSWRFLYVAAFNNSHSYSLRQPEKHIVVCAEWFRIAGFLVDSRKLFMTARLALPPVDDGSEISIELTGACFLNNVRPGIWIADINIVRCSPCNINGCKGTIQVLDARHRELYLESEFRNGTWEYEDLGTYSSDGPLDASIAAIFNHRDINRQHIANILDVKSWMRTSSDLLPRACFSTGGVALGTNLGPNNGLLSRFQDMTRAGEIVSAKIMQQVQM